MSQTATEPADTSQASGTLDPAAPVFVTRIRDKEQWHAIRIQLLNPEGGAATKN